MNTLDKPLNLLVVEDNDDHAHLIRISLHKKHTIGVFERAADGQEALDFLNEQLERPPSEQYDIVLLDVNLPGKSGLEVLKEIKENPRLLQLPVIMLSTSGTESDRSQAYKYHANSYLVKPIDYQRFLSLIEDLGHYWGRWNQGPKPLC